jgi:hypothetical protein
VGLLPTVIESTISYAVVTVGNPTFIKRKEKKDAIFD